jgi:predicted nucleotidyltransferase
VDKAEFGHPLVSSTSSLSSRIDSTDRQLLDTIVSRIQSADKGHIQRVICFGSRINGNSSPDSDIDILVVVEPADDGWGPRENIAERKRIETEIGTLPARLDLWVRTIDQYEEARGVIGGHEHAAEVSGVVLCSRPVRRPPIILRSPDDIRYRNVCDWLELARRLLGRSVQIRTVSRVRDGKWYPSEHFAWRACMAAIGAVFVWRQVAPPSKRDSVETWLLNLENLEPRLGAKVNEKFWEFPLSALLAQAVLRTVAKYLSNDEHVAEQMQHLQSYLHQSIERLADVPALKG